MSGGRQCNVFMRLLVVGRPASAGLVVESSLAVMTVSSNMGRGAAVEEAVAATAVAHNDQRLPTQQLLSAFDAPVDAAGAHAEDAGGV